ncbi:tautomerase family protein [Dietzia sp.]|uniref:tautomerase family protein n=1 Tax=Dietzia sp. TaxID=1871616 RepID=UPI002FDB8E54
MPFIEIKQFAGDDDAEKKSEILAAVTAAYCEATGKDPAKVHAILTEVPPGQWAVGGKTF